MLGMYVYIIYVCGFCALVCVHMLALRKAVVLDYQNLGLLIKIPFYFIDNPLLMFNLNIHCIEEVFIHSYTAMYDGANLFHG